MLRRYSLLAAVFSAVLLAGLGAMMVFAPGAQGFAQCRETRIAGGEGAIGGPFTLTDHTGATVTQNDVIDGPTLVYFGYTYCPDVCPYDNARNAQAVDRLTELGHDVTPVFISVDHKRDTVARLAEYVRFVHPDMVGLTGTEAQLRDAAQEYRAFYSFEDTDDEFYLIDHTTFTYLMMPGHGFVELFRRDVEPGAMADRVACFIANA